MGRTTKVVILALAFPVLLGAKERRPQASGRNYAEGLGRAWVQSALNAAVTRLQNPACRQLFLDFSDRDGVSVGRRLEDLGITPDEYLTRWMWFVEGSRQPQCRNRDIAAFTQAGSRVVYVCSSRVVTNHTPDGDIVLIHEMLHSLGLQENPPTPDEITRRVLERCTPKGSTRGTRGRRHRLRPDDREYWPGWVILDRCRTRQLRTLGKHNR